MTQKKKPTPEQIQEFRRIYKTAVTSEDYDKVNAFTDEYDTFPCAHASEAAYGNTSIRTSTR